MGHLPVKVTLAFLHLSGKNSQTADGLCNTSFQHEIFWIIQFWTQFTQYPSHLYNITVKFSMFWSSECRQAIQTFCVIFPISNEFFIPLKYSESLILSDTSRQVFRQPTEILSNSYSNSFMGKIISKDRKNSENLTALICTAHLPNLNWAMGSLGAF